MSRHQVQTSFVSATVAKVGMLTLFTAMLFSSDLILPQVAAQESTETEETPPVKKPRPTMPEGWENLTVLEFNNAFKTLVGQRPGPYRGHVRQISHHAWDTFLNNEQFVATGDFTQLRRLINHFRPRVKYLYTGVAPEALAAAKKVVWINSKTLQTRFLARLEAQPELLSGIELKTVRSIQRTMNRLKIGSGTQIKLMSKWMDGNDWQSMTPNQLGYLMSKVSARRINPKKFSVRWTGKITAPTTGNYTFEQLKERISDGALKLKINNQMVMDSTPVRGEAAEARAARYKSQPVMMTAGQAVEFQAEFIYRQRGGLISSRPRFPMAVLLWESSQLQKQIVPTVAFSPPAGFEEANAKGLKGEYYLWKNAVKDDPKTEDVDESTPSDKWAKLLGTRLDPGIQMIWQNSRIYGRHDAQQRAIAKIAIPKILDASFLTSLEEMPMKKAGITFSNAAINMMHQMTPAQRIEFMQNLTDRPIVLKMLTRTGMFRLCSYAYMLPSRPHYELIGAWADAKRDPRTRASDHMGWDRWGYLGRNVGTYINLGRLLTAEYKDGTLMLWDEHLERESGHCNLVVVKITNYSSTAGGFGNLFRTMLDLRLKDDSLTGDQRSTWLVARAIAEEPNGGGGPTRLERAYPYLKEALQVAESDTYRFKAFNELVTRYITMNQLSVARRMIAEYSPQFTSKAQQHLIKGWEKDMKLVKAVHARRLRAADRRLKKARITELTKQLKAAQESGNIAAADRYQATLLQLNPPKEPATEE